MPAPAVVEGFHILEDRPPGRLPRREGRAVDELVLQAAEEALHRREPALAGWTPSQGRFHQHRERTMAQERKRRRFTAEYKAEAVKRLEESGKALQQVAADLGVHAELLRTWRNERLAAGSAEALARRKAEAAEMARLKRENKRLEQEIQLLKRSAAFFAREAVPT